jgi:hypothetical protein
MNYFDGRYREAIKEAFPELPFEEGWVQGPYTRRTYHQREQTMNALG